MLQGTAKQQRCAAAHPPSQPPSCPEDLANEIRFLHLWWKPEWYKGPCSLGLVLKWSQGATAVCAEASSSKALLHISL